MSNSPIWSEITHLVRLWRVEELDKLANNFSLKLFFARVVKVVSTSFPIEGKVAKGPVSSSPRFKVNCWVRRVSNIRPRPGVRLRFPPKNNTEVV